MHQTLLASVLQSVSCQFVLQLAGLSADDMIAVKNMRCLCASDTKKSSTGGFTMKFELRKVTCCIIKLCLSSPIM